MKLLLIVALLFMSSVQAKPGFEREGYYSDQICSEVYKGTPVTSGKFRPDCETAFAVIEADWGDYNGKGSLAKVYECLGQAAFYGHIYNKQPVCLLLVASEEEKQVLEQYRPVFEKSNVGLTFELVQP